MKVKKLFIGFIVCFAAMNLLAQNNTVMNFSLAEAQNYAIENFFMSKNAALDIESAKKLIWETTAIGLPQATVTAQYQHIPGEIPVFSFPGQNGEMVEVPIAQENNTTYGGTVTQLVFSGEYIVGLQASKTFKLLSEQNYKSTQIDIKQIIAGTYYTLLILRGNYSITEQTLANLRLNYEQTKKSYEAGLVEDTDVDQLNLFVKRSENALLSIGNQIRYMERLFKYQLGIDLNYEIKLTDNIDDLITINMINDSTYVFNLDENINYQLLSTNEKLNLLSVKRQQSLLLPTVAGFYNYSNLTNPSDINFSIKHVLGLSLNFPIFQSGGRIAKIDQAKIDLLKSQNIKEQQSRGLELAAEQSKYDYQTAVANYFNEKENFILSEKVLKKTTEKFKLGMISSLDLTLINNQFLQAQLTYATAIQGLLAAKVNLDKAYSKL
jgi:outer membrane protein